MTILKPIIQIENTLRESMSMEKLLGAQHHRCFYCDGYFSEKYAGPLRMSRDHLFPKWWGLGLGGNMVYAHSQCNSIKNGRSPTNKEIIKFFQLYRKNAPKRYWKRTILATRNNKPRFKLVITPELIKAHCR